MNLWKYTCTFHNATYDYLNLTFLPKCNSNWIVIWQQLKHPTGSFFTYVVTSHNRWRFLFDVYDLWARYNTYYSDGLCFCVLLQRQALLSRTFKNTNYWEPVENAFLLLHTQFEQDQNSDSWYFIDIYLKFIIYMCISTSFSFNYIWLRFWN